MVRGRRARGPKAADEPNGTSPKRKDVKLEKKPPRGPKGPRHKSAEDTSGMLSPPKSQITNYFQVLNGTNGVNEENVHLDGLCKIYPFDEVIETSGLTYESCISLLQSQGVNMSVVCLKSVDSINGHSDSDTDSRVSTNTLHNVQMCKLNGFAVENKANDICHSDDSPGSIDLTDSDCDSQSAPVSISPNLRLSPRKHASTLSRCAEVFVESTLTPHRIKLCDPLQEKVTARKFLPLSFADPPKPLAARNGFQVPLAPKAADATANHKLTEYFPVRRSIRKTKKAVLEEKMRDFEIAVREMREDGLEVASFNGKGRGVIAARDFHRGEYVVEYSGELIPVSEARDREAHYARTHAGCYMYYFKHNDVQYCIDATAETGRLGRLVNHSRNGNLVPRSIMVDKRPCLVLVAATEIPSGTELTYDYGDRSKESLKHHPWLAL